MARAAAAVASATRDHRWVRILDDWFRIPGTNFRFGIDGFLGMLLPGIGDAVTGAGAAALLTMALRERVPTVVLVRMVANITVDVVFGLIPGLGDAFDFVWKSNRRNLDLIEKYKRTGSARAGVFDYLFVGLGLFLAVVSVVLPLVMLFVWGDLIGSTLVDWFTNGPPPIPTDRIW